MDKKKTLLCSVWYFSSKLFCNSRRGDVMFGIIDIVALVVEVTSEFLSLLRAIGQICDGFYHD